MRKLFLVFAIMIVACGMSKQNQSPIKFYYQNGEEQGFDTVNLVIENTSPVTTYYYLISARGVTDTGFVPLLGDINSLGKNDFASLKPIKPNEKKIDRVSKRMIYFVYGHKNFRKIEFAISYSEKRDFESKMERITLSPIE